MNWIKITNSLPCFGERVLFRAVINWKTNKPDVFFDDELTMDEETLEYGQSAYLLKNNTDYLVSQSPNIDELADEFVTHWCKIDFDNFKK